MTYLLQVMGSSAAYCFYYAKDEVRKEIIKKAAEKIGEYVSYTFKEIQGFHNFTILVKLRRFNTIDPEVLDFINEIKQDTVDNGLFDVTKEAENVF